MAQENVLFAQRVKQNNQEFLIGIFSIRHILSFTRYTERLIVAYDEENLPIYNPEIQRKVESSRVEKIADFLLDDPDALFPTNLVLSIPDVAIEGINELENNIVRIELNTNVFSEIRKNQGHVYLSIIDGQHRVRGIEKAIERLQAEIESARNVANKSSNDQFRKQLEKKTRLLTNLLNIDLVVSFFVDPTLEFQAMIFSTINRTQKSVPQSLVYSLFGLTERDTPQKTALQTVLALNAFEKSPFFNRIKLHGGNYERNQSPPLTQASMVKSIIDLISINMRESERDRFRDRKDLLTNCTPNLPFRKYYANNNDNFITDIMFSFFSAVRNTFSNNGILLWDFVDNTKPANILQTTVGYQALLQILVDILKIEKEDSNRDDVQIYHSYLVRAKNLNFENIERYPFTSKSKNIFYLDLSLSIWPPASNNDERLIKLGEALNK